MKLLNDIIGIVRLIRIKSINRMINTYYEAICCYSDNSQGLWWFGRLSYNYRQLHMFKYRYVYKVYDCAILCLLPKNY